MQWWPHGLCFSVYYKKWRPTNWGRLSLHGNGWNVQLPPGEGENLYSRLFACHVAIFSCLFECFHIKILNRNQFGWIIPSGIPWNMGSCLKPFICCVLSVLDLVKFSGSIKTSSFCLQWSWGSNLRNPQPIKFVREVTLVSTMPVLGDRGES